MGGHSDQALLQTHAFSLWCDQPAIVDAFKLLVSRIDKVRTAIYSAHYHLVEDTLSMHERRYMSEEPKKLPLLASMMKRSRLPWFWTTVILSTTLLLFFIIAALLDGALNKLADWNSWRWFLASVVTIIYVLSIYPFTNRLWERAVQTFLQLLSKDNSEILARIHLPNRRWEWVSVLLGIAFWLAVVRPWLAIDQWLSVYESITSLLMLSILSWIIYYGITSTRRLNILSRQQLNLDIFNTTLVPVARYSMGITFAFIGGISLSLLFQSIESLLTWQTITIYAILVCVTILLFFLSMWSTHNVMAGAKRREYQLAKSRLEEVTRELRDNTEKGLQEGTEKLYSAVAAWGIYERRVREAPEWPYNATILRRLFASIFVPFIVYLIKILFNLRIGL